MLKFINGDLEEVHAMESWQSKDVWDVSLTRRPLGGNDYKFIFIVI